MSLPRLHPDDLQKICTHISKELSSKLENLISKRQQIQDFQTFSVSDVAKILNLHETTVLRYINHKDKLLKANKIGKEWIITQENLLSFIGS